MEAKAGIYFIRNLQNNNIYIGQAINLNLRKISHFSYLKNNKHCNQHLQNAFNKYGESSFIFEVVEYCHPSALLEREQYHLDLHFDNCKKCYNICSIAENKTGVLHSEQAKNKMRIAKLGNKNGLGHKVTETHKNKLRQLNLGKILPKTIRDKISKSLIGKKLSLETRQKISISNKGQKRSDKFKKECHARMIGNKRSLGNKRSKETIDKQIDKTSFNYKLLSPDGLIYEGKNINQFCREHKLNPSHIGRVIKGTMIHYKQWKKYE